MIGNPGIDFLRESHEHQILDLGQAWKDITGLPFVYAVWAVRRDKGIGNLYRRLFHAKVEGQVHLEDIIANHKDFDFELRDSYLRQNIRFELGELEKDGIMEFVRRLRKVVGEPVFVPNYVSVI